MSALCEWCSQQPANPAEIVIYWRPIGTNPGTREVCLDCEDSATADAAGDSVDAWVETGVLPPVGFPAPVPAPAERRAA